MPKDPVSTPDLADDDDIVDLLEVVKPGKAPSAKAEAGPNDVDFSKDLDAMLNELSKAASEKEAEEELDASSATVDADEKLRMPSNADVDELLSSLDSAVADEPDEPEAAPSSVPVDMDDLDELLAQAKAAPKAPPAPAAPADDDDPFAAAMKAAFEPKAEDALEEEPSAPAASEPLPAVEDEAPEAPEAVPSGDDSVDLNELDALLDNVLAGAPPSGRVKESAPAEASAAAPAEEGVPAAAGQTVDFSPLFARLDNLDGALGEMHGKIASMEAALGSFELVEKEFHNVNDNIQALDKFCVNLKAQVDEQGAAFEKFAARLSAVEGGGGGAPAGPGGGDERLEQLLTETEDIKNSLEITQAALGELRGNLDKMAAEAAARVIREEIAALLQEK